MDRKNINEIVVNGQKIQTTTEKICGYEYFR